MDKDIDDLSAEKAIDKISYYVDVVTNLGVLKLFSALFEIEYKILSYCLKRKNVHPSDLADELDESRPVIASKLKELEDKNYISRVMNQKNKREILVNITDKGVRYIEIVKEQLIKLIKNWFSLLSENDIKDLFRILDISTDYKKYPDSLYSESLPKI